MAKMMKLVVFFTLTFSFAAANPQCLSYASLSDAGDECICPAGQHGVGDFCCADNSKSICMIKGDPVSTSFTGVRALDDFPCGQFILEFKDVSVRNLCTVRVLSSGDIASHGQFYNDQLIISVTAKPLLGRAESGIIRIQGEKFTDPKTGQVINIVQNPGPFTFSFLDRDVTLTYDDVNGIFSVEACGLSTRFRPVGNAPSIQTAGICLVVPPRFLGLGVTSPVCTAAAGVDIGPFRSLSERLLSNIISTAINSITGAELGILEDVNIRPVCDAIRSTMNSCTADRQAMAMKECANIFTNSTIRWCLVLRKSDIRAAFRDCVQAVCDGDQAACNRMQNDRGFKTCYHSALKCNTW